MSENNLDTGVIETDLILSNWRFGSVQAERLASHVLDLQGFEDIQPQATLGGPDGKKDIVCTLAGRKYIAAVYFPTTNHTFTAIKKKFLSDAKGIAQNHANGFVFLTNQHLTLRNVAKLLEQPVLASIDCRILHLEKLRLELDSPAGYGARLQFLRKSMSISEQISFFEHDRQRSSKAIGDSVRAISVLNRKIDRVLSQQSELNRTVSVVAEGMGLEVKSSLSDVDGLEPTILRSIRGEFALSNKLCSEVILLIHRLVARNLPTGQIGVMRASNVWLTNPADATLTPTMRPIDHSEVNQALGILLDEWNLRFDALKKVTELKKVRELAKFHATILKIHPFYDGNGRVARTLLMQQCLDLFQVADLSMLSKGQDYFAALRDADEGNLKNLTEIIFPVIGRWGQELREIMERFDSESEF